MATMNVSLPDLMKAWVEGQAETGRYGNASDYIRDLIRKDQDRQARIAEVQSLLDEGRASGVSALTRDDIVREARIRAGVSDRDGL